MFHANKRRRLKQILPYPLNMLASKIEYRGMAALSWLTDADWLYQNSTTNSILDFLANRVMLPFIHGEVITPYEIERLVKNLELEGHIIANGICECRHGMGVIADSLEDGLDPNYTCVMIGDWGKGHLLAWPDEYELMSGEEIIERTWFWHKRGRINTGWGCHNIHGFMISFCNCMPEYCVPLRCQQKRGYQVFLPGYSYARIDPEKCIGPENCEINCPSRCYFNAIEIHDGKAFVNRSKCHGCGQCFIYCPTGAAVAIQKKDHELVYCHSDLLEEIKTTA